MVEVVKQDWLGYSAVFMGHYSVQGILEQILQILFIFLTTNLIHATNTLPSSLFCSLNARIRTMKRPRQG